MKLLCAALVLLAFHTSTALASAEVPIYDTFSLPLDSFNRRVGILNVEDLTPTQWADGFVVADQNVLLTSIEVFVARTIGFGDWVIRIWDDDDFEPGTVLESWTLPGQTSGFESRIAGSVLLPELVAGNRYWVSVKFSNEFSGGLWAAAQATTDRVVAESSNMVPEPWIDQAPATPGVMRISGIPLPEPDITALTGLAAFVVAVLHARRQPPALS